MGVDVLNASEQFIWGLSTEAMMNQGVKWSLDVLSAANNVAAGPIYEAEARERIIEAMEKIADKEKSNPGFQLREDGHVDKKYLEERLFALIVQTARAVIEESGTEMHVIHKRRDERKVVPLMTGVDGNTRPIKKYSLELLAKNQNRVWLAFNALRGNPDGEDSFNIAKNFQDFA